LSGIAPPARVISAAGFVTSLGGGALPEAVRSAMAEAGSATWRPDDLQAWAGETIARVTGAESGWVTSGAAAGLTLAAAACIARTLPREIDALPEPTGAPAEIIVQRGHRNAYDRAFRTAGATIVEVGYPHKEGVGLTYEWQLEAAFGEHTVAVGHLALAEADGIPLQRVCEIAAARGVPVIVDAAAELPPASNLRRFIDEGAALVAFSGGKALRGPQGSGVVAGSRDLIESVRLQTLDMDVDVEEWVAREGVEPPHHGLGRSLKVGKEEIMGLVAALEEFVRRDHEAEAGELAGWLDSLLPIVSHWPARVATELHFYPRLLVDVGVGPARAWSERLAGATPAVVVPHAPLARGQLMLAAEAITPQDRELVRDTLVATAAVGMAAR
jgi:L-seryl-tRNA(Ser) seleniumtransferase